MQVRGRIVRRAGKPSSQRITGTYIDVTQRHEIDAARQELQQRLAKLLVQVPGTVYQFRLRPDGSSCFPYASPGIADIYGITPSWRRRIPARHLPVPILRILKHCAPASWSQPARWNCGATNGAKCCPTAKSGGWRPGQA